MLKKCFLSLLAVVLFLSQAQAAAKYLSEPVSQFLFKELVPSPVAVKVLKVIDPVTFIGEDKTIYTLGGIEIPAQATAKGDVTLEASKTMALLIEDKDLRLYLTKNKERGRLNRMNQNIVQAELKQDKIWVEGEMLAAGLARVRTTAANPELQPEMLKIEAQARDAKRGLWADPKLQGLTPETAKGQENAFQIIEGTPKDAAVTRNMIFLNFSDNYREDFTIGIPSSLRTAFAKRNIDPLQFAHVKLRVRGWLQSYNGPFIEIDHPEQIEILGKMSPFTAARDKPEPSPGATGMRSIAMPAKPVIAEPKIAEPKKPDVAQPQKKNNNVPVHNQ